jgi:hypothetical protein
VPRHRPCASLQGEEVRHVEPLPALLACLRHVVQLRRRQQQEQQEATLGSDAGTAAELGPGAVDPTDAAGLLSAGYSSCVSRLLLSELEHFDLDRSREWSPASPKGLLHQLQASQLLGCLEVVMEGIVERATGGGPCCRLPAPDGAPLLPRDAVALLQDACSSAVADLPRPWHVP